MSAAHDFHSGCETAVTRLGVQASDRVLALGCGAACRGGSRVGLRVGSVADLQSFRDDSFDKLIGLHVPDLGSDPEREIRDLERVLRPGGELLFGFGCEDGDPRAGERLADRLAAAGFEEIRIERRVQGGPEMAWTGARRSEPRRPGEER